MTLALSTANSSNMHTYGFINFNLSLGLQRFFTWKFIIPTSLSRSLDQTSLLTVDLFQSPVLPTSSSHSDQNVKRHLSSTTQSCLPTRKSVLKSKDRSQPTYKGRFTRRIRFNPPDFQSSQTCFIYFATIVNYLHQKLQLVVTI